MEEISMKNTIKIVSVVLLVCMLVLGLASCAKKLSGTYSAEVDLGLVKFTANYEFSGSKVTVTKITNPIIGDSKTTTFEGEYEIIENDDETMDIKFTFETEDDDIKSGTFDFEDGEDYIKIGIVKYNLKK